ncbi:MAG TPA: aminotransferase class V-fold PLP-dependent enzyme [Kofleriaceae bacterium]|nr:aminotransferase class V-fold PLP-dependent enzyme [Kofleriaceae bacterium]
MLEVPIYNKTLRRDVGRGELDYEVYLHTRELLALQTPRDALVVPDELVFQVMHQTQELWLKCIAFEVANLVEALDGESVFGALSTLDRIVLMQRNLQEQIRVLFTLSPDRFHTIRRSLGNGSGLESPGYNQVLIAADAAGEALDRMIGRRKAALLDIYRAPDRYPDVHRVAERFVDWDGAFQSWLMEHFTLVRRTLGIDKSVKALDGFPTVALGARMMRPLFSELWATRVEMNKTWTRDGGFAPGADRAVSPHTTQVLPVIHGSGADEPGEPTAPVGPPVDLRDTEPRIRDTTAGPREAAPLERSIASIRGEFPLLETCVYLNSSSAGATPRAARQALDDYWRTMQTWRDEVWQRWWIELGDHANALAALIGAPAGSVVCDTNLATLFGRVLSCFDYRARPRVVTSDLEFPSLPFVISGFARYGVEPVVVASRDGVAIDVAAVVAAIDDRTQLVCLSHATFATGALLDVAPIVRRAREVGALVVLDAYQSAGALPIDVAALDVDFLLGGSHKWLCGSYETAFLYVRPGLMSQLEPAATGWIASADPLSFAPPTGWADTARRFASGTPAVLPALFSRPGLAIVRDLGLETIRGLSLAHTDHVIARADDAGIPVITPRDHARRAGIVTLRFQGAANVARQLIAANLVCSYRGGIRIAPHFYSTSQEIDRFMDELVRLARRSS